MFIFEFYVKLYKKIVLDIGDDLTLKSFNCICNHTFAFQ